VTGKVVSDGERWTHSDIKSQVERLGGSSVAKGSQSGAATLLVMGAFAGDVIDRDLGWSKNVVFVAQQRLEGNHICLIDADGYAKLLNRSSAPCLKLKRIAGSKKYRVLRPRMPKADTSTPVDTVVGLPWRAAKIPAHRPVELQHDLEALDRGSAAHEHTTARLRDHLSETQLMKHGPGAPKFDAAWLAASDPDAVCIAEVKSLTFPTERQQIRLGLGQVLDYVTQLSAGNNSRTFKPVLVMEKQPKGSHWVDVAARAGVQLSWAPDFPRIATDGTLSRD
jgi:hypothetical protein